MIGLAIAYTESCEDCLCCSMKQCREGSCPEDSVGHSTCPCTA